MSSVLRIIIDIILHAENYQRLELEKKSRRSVKATQKGPIIRYHSLTMPLIEEMPDEDEEDM